MNKVLEIYLPVMEVKIYCHSKIIDDMGAFTRIVLENIGDNVSIDDFVDVIQLKKEIVEEEIEYLSDHGLIDKDKLSLTELGKEYYSVIKCINQFETIGFDAYIDLHNGDVLPLDGKYTFIEKDAVSNNEMVMDIKVSEVFFRNDNYQNSKEIVQEYIVSNGILNESYMGSLYTTLKIGPKGYFKLIIDDYQKYDGNNIGPFLSIRIPLGVYYFQKYYKNLDGFRTILDTLEKVKIFDESLLSKKSSSLLEVYFAEKEEPLISQAFDLYSLVTMTGTDSCDYVEDDDKTDIELPAQTISIEIEKFNDIRLEEVDYKECSRIVHIPYHLLLESEESHA